MLGGGGVRGHVFNELHVSGFGFLKGAPGEGELQMYGGHVPPGSHVATPLLDLPPLKVLSVMGVILIVRFLQIEQIGIKCYPN